MEQIKIGDTVISKIAHLPFLVTGIHEDGALELESLTKYSLDYPYVQPHFFETADICVVQYQRYYPPQFKHLFQK